MRAAIALTLLLFGASPVFAQSTYIGASFVGDIARFSKVELRDPRPSFTPPDISGETAGIGLVIGRGLGEHWGVEFEFVRPGELSALGDQEIALPVSPAIFPPLPPIEVEFHLRQRHTTYNATAWYAHAAGDRVELAFHGGVSFVRSTQERSYDVRVPALVMLARDVLGAIAPRTEITEHGVDPVIGMDARIAFGDHWQVVPGIRLQGVSVGGQAGWLIRPGIGVRWNF